MTGMGFRAAPIVPDRGPGPPSDRAWIAAYAAIGAACLAAPFVARIHGRS